MAGTVIVRSAVVDVRVELRVTMLGVMLVSSPVGVDDEKRLILPENPFDPVRVRVAFPVVPGARFRNIGLAVMLKEGAITRTVMYVLLVIPLLVAVTTTL